MICTQHSKVPVKRLHPQNAIQMYVLGKEGMREREGTSIPLRSNGNSLFREVSRQHPLCPKEWSHTAEIALRSLLARRVWVENEPPESAMNKNKRIQKLILSCQTEPSAAMEHYRNHFITFLENFVQIVLTALDTEQPRIEAHLPAALPLDGDLYYSSCSTNTTVDHVPSCFHNFTFSNEENPGNIISYGTWLTWLCYKHYLETFRLL